MMINQDTALTKLSQDSLGRENIVDLIVESINDLTSSYHPCFVYGIYGKWGEGKTSLMNFVKERLLEQENKDSISIAVFNPWLVNNDEALLREFFKSILTYPDDKVRCLLKKYGSLAAFASKTIVNAFVPGIGSALASGIESAQNAFDDSQDTLFELKNKTSEAIRKSGSHLVVMIDDVDRLDKEELHAVFRLIRQVADFPNCIYVIAMDVDMVSKAIGDYYGNGSVQDGRKFIDKIVQVPISLPQISNSEMRQIVYNDLSRILDGYTDEEEMSLIAEMVFPFIDTIRSLKRYCNQLSFVLPHLKDEVNMGDLCLLEAIKNLSNEAYNRIYDSRSNLFRELDPSDYFSDKDKASELADHNYKTAVEYISENLLGKTKDIVISAVDELFNNRSFDYQQDLDKKRLLTNEYFAKYFVQRVPRDIIPDKCIDSLKDSIAEGLLDNVKNKFNDWFKKYSPDEVKRSAIHLIRLFSYGEEQSSAASIIAKSLSVCKLAKGLPDHILADKNDMSTFVPVSIIRRYMFVQMEDVAGIRVWDDKQLDETLTFIFSNAELDFCMSMLPSCREIFNTGSYYGSNVLPVLIERFKTLDFKGQFHYSKFLLKPLFKYWKRIDAESFSEYANDLFVNKEIPYLEVFDKMIDGKEDYDEVETFVKLFYEQLSIITERISNDCEGNPSIHSSVRIFLDNYKPIVDSLTSR